MTALAHRFQETVEHLQEELLALHVAQSATTVMILQLVEVLILRPEVGKVLIAGEGIEVGEHGIALDMSRVIEIDMLGVSVHGAHLLPYLVGGIGEVDAVAEALGHLLLTVGAGKTAGGEVLGQQDVGLHEHRCIGGIEAAHELTRHLQHRLLILSCRHGGRFEEGDVGSLRHGVAEEAEGDVGLEVAHLDLCLHRGVALDAAHGDKIHQIGGQLGKLGYLALNEKGASFRVETGGQVVECHLDDVLSNLLGVVGIVGECLHIGHEDEHLIIVAGVLQFYTAAK